MKYISNHCDFWGGKDIICIFKILLQILFTITLHKEKINKTKQGTAHTWNYCICYFSYKSPERRLCCRKYLGNEKKPVAPFLSESHFFSKDSKWLSPPCCLGLSQPSCLFAVQPSGPLSLLLCTDHHSLEMNCPRKIAWKKFIHIRRHPLPAPSCAWNYFQVKLALVPNKTK